jgi:hypothetical protein
MNGFRFYPTFLWLDVKCIEIKLFSRTTSAVYSNLNPYGRFLLLVRPKVVLPDTAGKG